MSSIKITKKQAKKLLELSFPDYTGRKLSVEFKDKITFYDTNWSGGTKNCYIAINANGKHGTLYAPAPWVNPIEGLTIDLPKDIILACRKYFCGHDLGITFYANPIHAPKFLESGL